MPGPTLNVYNHHALAMLMDDGLRRWVPGVEQGHLLLRELREAMQHRRTQDCGRAADAHRVDDQYRQPDRVVSGNGIPTLQS